MLKQFLLMLMLISFSFVESASANSICCQKCPSNNSKCNPPAVQPAPPTSAITICPQPEALFQLGADGKTLSPHISIPKGTANVLVAVHGYGASPLSLLALAQFFQAVKNPHTKKPYYDVILFYQWDTINCPIEAGSCGLVALLKKYVPKSVSIDLQAHSLGGPCVRWAVEQLGLGSRVNAVFLIDTLNYCLPNTLTFPVTQAVIAVLAPFILETNPLCTQALNPVPFQVDNGTCAEGNASDKPTCFFETLNANGSKYAESIKYFAMAGNVPSDGLFGVPADVGDTINALYLLHGDGGSDGVLSINCSNGVGVLESKSNFLASYGPPPNIVRPHVPHDHFTVVGLNILNVAIPPTIIVGSLPVDVQNILATWLSLVYP